MVCAVCIHREIVSILLDCEASPTILDSQDCSPLHLAAWNGHTDICKQLITASDDLAFVNLQVIFITCMYHRLMTWHRHQMAACIYWQFYVLWLRESGCHNSVS